MNVAKLLDEFTELERIYSSIEKGEPGGSIYEEYSRYLKNVREAKKVMEREVNRINKEEKAEITNANLLISAFKEEIDKHD